MPLDFVIDTNVLAHSSQKDYPKREACLNLINILMDSNDTICMDENGYFKLEYDKHVPSGSEAATLLLTMHNQERINYKDRRIPPHVNNFINRTGIKQSDRIFVRISYKSQSKLLVSQEKEDFTDYNRGRIKNWIAVDVIEAIECLQKFV